MTVREKVKVVGVDCPTCALSISRELSRLGARIDLDVTSGDAVVEYEEDNVTLRDIVRAVRAAGYDVEKRSLVISVEVEEETSRFEDVVAKLEGVIECRYSPVTELARIVYNPYTTTEDEILDAISRLGWKAVRAEVVEEGEKKLKPVWIVFISFALGFLTVVYHSLEVLGLAPSAGVLFYATMATIVLLLNVDLIYKGLRALVRLSPNMDSLISLSSTVSYFFSLATLTSPVHGTAFFEASAGVLGFVSLGKYLEERLRTRALKAIQNLTVSQNSLVTIVREGSTLQVEIEEVRVGDIVEVKAGEKIPVDGVIVEGWGYVDESAFTGEPLPRFKTAEKRDPVLAGTTLNSGYLKVHATRVGRDTNVAYIIQTVRESQFRKPNFQRIADRLVGHMTWAVIVLSVATFAYWLAVGASLAEASLFAASVLTVTCPCPLGIAVPLVVAVASIKAASFGVLVRGGDVFERILEVDTVLFDKTGTLTVGSPKVHAVHVFNGYGEEQVLSLSGSAELRSEHPLAKAILDRCRSLGVKPSEPNSYDHVPGLGVIAEVNGLTVAVGSRALAEKLGVELPQEVLRRAEALSEAGSTVLFVSVDGRLAGLLEVRDEVKEDAGEVVQYLKKEGLTTILVTGDNKGAGESIANQLKLDSVYAEMRPEDKAELVEKIQEDGGKVLFIGDGVNDAPAISKAFLGVAVGGGADISKEAGDVVLANSRLSSVSKLRMLGKAVRRKALENLAWAFAYNAVLVPIAMGALYVPFKLSLKPEWAALAMILSDISVVLNSASLLGWDYKAK
ncbi:MAG: heavy metal translocating P-type ATPase [Thermofilaceae archaeon]|nr:heavy metal translocating P-type ATPase [Thermofilaceae archaeon]MCX8181351.1 heavy metal translocating P-type ATPase [Thermofilaceae archaeon]MDW8003594.1 heavy metal translocating P-type ATPase [Thermofilaceae archaeon]